MNRFAAVAALLALGGALTGCAGGTGVAEGGGGAASCAALMDFDGARYTGYGSTAKVPVEGERLGAGTLPPCDDTGPGGPSETARSVAVHRIPGVDPGTAVITDGDQLWVHGDRETVLPFLRKARRPVPCTLPGPTTITGTWTGVTSPHPDRYDGDVRAPFTVELRTGDRAVVPKGWAAAQLRARSAESAPAPSKEQVRQLLWHDNPSAFQLHCEGDRFVLDHLSGVQQ